MPYSTKLSRGVRFGLVSLVLLSFAGGCRSAADEAQARPMTRAREEDAGRIGAALLTGVMMDFSLGQLALARSTNPQVRELATAITEDDATADSQILLLLDELEVVPVASLTSVVLEERGRNAIAQLDGLSAERFDQAYVMHAVEYHRRLLETIDERLLPVTESEPMRELLEALSERISARVARGERVAGALFASPAARQSREDSRSA